MKKLTETIDSPEKREGAQIDTENHLKNDMYYPFKVDPHSIFEQKKEHLHSFISFSELEKFVK